MAARRKTTPPKAKPSPAPIGEHGPETVSVTGVELIDGRPFFAEHDGVRMHRRQWLEATRDQRSAELITALTVEPTVADIGDEPGFHRKTKIEDQ